MPLINRVVAELRPHFGPVQRRLLTVTGAIAVSYPLMTTVLRQQYFDPTDYYTYQGTQGPLQAVIATDGTLKAGAPISHVKPGESFAWITTICFATDARAIASLNFVHVSDNAVMNIRSTVIDPKDHRCGPKVVDFQVPIDAPPGVYQLQRRLLFEPKGKPMVSDALEPLYITVGGG